MAVASKTLGRPQAVLYAWYSSDQQNEMSCEDQLDQARKTTDRLGFDVVGEYRDKAISGMTLMHSRSGIMAMKARVAQGGVSAVIIEASDRIGRRVSNIMGLAEWVETHGVAAREHGRDGRGQPAVARVSGHCCALA